MIVAILVVGLEAVFMTVLFFSLVMLLFVKSKTGLRMVIKLAVGSMTVGIFSAVAVLSAEALTELVIVVLLFMLRRSDRCKRQ